MNHWNTTAGLSWVLG